MPRSETCLFCTDILRSQRSKFDICPGTLNFKSANHQKTITAARTTTGCLISTAHYVIWGRENWRRRRCDKKREGKRRSRKAKKGKRAQRKHIASARKTRKSKEELLQDLRMRLRAKSSVYIRSWAVDKTSYELTANAVKLRISIRSYAPCVLKGSKGRDTKKERKVVIFEVSFQ